MKLRINEKYARLWREWRGVFIFLLLMTVFRSSFADWNFVPSGSMKPTLRVGDVILVDRLAYNLKIPFTTVEVAKWAAPRRGDIVVFFSPKNGERLVKRVIGLPGDVIAMDNDRLLINGRAVHYTPIGLSAFDTGGFFPLARHEEFEEHLAGSIHLLRITPTDPAMRSFGPVRVPAGHYFMMGDNRDNSYDSRYFGFVPRRDIVGRVRRVLVSFDPGDYYLPRSGRYFYPLRSLPEN